MEYRSSKSRLNDYKEYKLNEIEKDINYCHPMRKHEKEYLDEETEKIKSEKLYYWSGWNIYDWLIIFILFITIILHIIPVALYNHNPNFDPDEDLIEGFSGGIEIVRDEDGYLEDIICHEPTDEVRIFAGKPTLNFHSEPHNIDASYFSNHILVQSKSHEKSIQ